FQIPNNHAPKFQNQGFQNQPFQVPNNQVQQGIPNEFSSYMKASESIMRNMQSQINELRAITTRSGVAYEGPSIPTNPSPKKVMERETEETTDKEQTNFQGSTVHIQPPVIPIPILEPDFAPMFRSLISNKEKLFELLSAPLNENCSAVLLKKLPEKLRDPGKFLIPCDFPRMVECSALADLGASINLMPLSVWKRLSLPELTTTLDFDADPRVPLIFGRPFVRMSRALIDVYGEEITLRFNDEAITFNLGHTSRYSSNYNAELINQINIIDVACDEYSQEVLGFLDGFKSGNPTSTDPMITSFPSFTPFEGGDFILEEIENYLSNGSIPPGIDDEDFDPEGDICLIQKLLNNDPFQLPPMDLKQVEVTKAKSSIEEPPELELKDLPSHLEYAYLEGTDKLPVIIAKSLKDDEKEALLKVLKSHKRAIAWKITDIKGIDPRFCTHKILMEEDYKPAVQSQRRVNPKIHEVIKKEVIKLLDAGMIYPISDSPWVSPIHCVPKKGGITVVANEDNELIPT
ncbi:hypothetical protein Tco_1049551, partial [Tanacetum coccineum]